MSFMLDEARRRWGIVFNEFRTACECVNSAWYHEKDKQALKAEEVHRLDALVTEVQKIKEMWEGRTDS